jgi:cytochrome oxidase Cu insertion factor (SCO1/SenC/PrrC family)
VLAACEGDSSEGLSAGRGSELSRAADDDWTGPELADFAMRDVTGREVRKRDLARRTLVLDFIFTTCAGPCPALSAGMAELQRELADSDVLLVSVTVDPQTDTLERLGAYARGFGADPRRWIFLRGEADQLAALASSVSLGVASDPSAQPGFQVTHSTKLLVIDGQGKVRGYYDGTSEQERARAAARARWLARR